MTHILCTRRTSGRHAARRQWLQFYGRQLPAVQPASHSRSFHHPAHPAHSLEALLLPAADGVVTSASLRLGRCRKHNRHQSCGSYRVVANTPFFFLCACVCVCGSMRENGGERVCNFLRLFFFLVLLSFVVSTCVCACDASAALYDYVNSCVNIHDMMLQFDVVILSIYLPNVTNNL